MIFFLKAEYEWKEKTECIGSYNIQMKIAIIC